METANTTTTIEVPVKKLAPRKQKAADNKAKWGQYPGFKKCHRCQGTGTKVRQNAKGVMVSSLCSACHACGYRYEGNKVHEAHRFAEAI